MNLDEQPLFRSLASLDLPADDFIIAGSGPMLAHGIRSTLGDLDVVARGAAWDKALTLGTPSPAPLGYVDHIVLHSGEIEILDGWFDYDADKVIDEFEIFCGIRFAPLGKVLEWKKRLDREKDREDIEAINRYMNDGN
ncbi:hypothetical protein HEP86_21350 [Streptomyces sp. RPA4-5]|uniref:hypothetical protein n=1 Tax=Streptomyces sp. RPA4-5 TaxID=2721245 RepID=UPI00143E28F2|nr:hypothetical protein [Streptomyces sp. RPA4-5]QIY56617.1 hypothetical protein HEP86_21350 [Streptomyces sp. RPA4-5]